MFIIVDLVIISIFALCILSGYKRGLTGCLIKILSFFIALIVASILFKPASAVIINNTQIDENIKTSIVQVFEKDEIEDKEENSSPILSYISDEVEKATQEKKNEIVNDTANQLSNKIINIMAFLILFIAVRIALIFVRKLTSLIAKLPLIKQCDKLGGILYGVFHSFIIVFIGFALITFFSTISNQYYLLNLINHSYIGSVLCNNNILVKLLF